MYGMYTGLCIYENSHSFRALVGSECSQTEGGHCASQVIHDDFTGIVRVRLKKYVGRFPKLGVPC